MSSDVIQSAVYGEIQVSQNQIYELTKGIIGLPGISNYVLLPFEGSEFFILHAMTDEISFFLVPAMKVEKTMSFQIDEETISILGAEKEDDIVPFLIINLIDNQPFVNMKAPLLIVPSTQKGCQYIINDTSYSVREPLIMKGLETC